MSKETATTTDIPATVATENAKLRAENERLKNTLASVQGDNLRLHEELKSFIRSLRGGATFEIVFNATADEVHKTAKEKGWWDSERNDGEMLCLIHSEISEALEALRAGNPADDKIPEFLGTEAELADVIIRIMDMAKARGWRVGEAVTAKMAMNKTRERMHGGKKF